jgi:hypothetical protein
VSKERAKNRAAREHEAALRTAAKGHEHDRQERMVSMKAGGSSPAGEAITPPQHHKHPKPAATKTQARTGGKGRPTPKQSGPRTPAGKTRAHAPVGRADGPLARRRRLRVRVLLLALLAVNVVVAVVWRDWPVSLAVLIVSVIAAPLLAGVLLRRK